MFRVMILMCCLGLLGCASTAKYENELNNYVGVSEDSLIAARGVPNKTYTLANGKKALEYVQKETFQSGGYAHLIPESSYHTGRIGNRTYSGTSTTYVSQTEPVQQHKLLCKTTFMLNVQGNVESWQHEGNNCVAD